MNYDHCLICHNELQPNISWTGLFLKEAKQVCCDSCMRKFDVIESDVCKSCSRPLDGLELKYIKDGCCYDCIRWEQDPQWQGLLGKNHALFTYNDFLKEVLARYKFRGDYLLARVFSENIRTKLRQFDFDYIVPIPLSGERLTERGFNQSEALIKEAGLPSTTLLDRVHSEKQSKKSREERLHLSSIFCLTSNAPSVIHKKILLFDDIYTTGSTLRYAAKELKKAGAKVIHSCTLAR